MTPVLTASGLVRRYRSRRGTVTALAGVDVDLVPGRVVGVVGPSASGKTTLVSLLAGWEPADDGRVEWPGGRPGWDRLTVVPQGFALVEEATVAENIFLASRTGAATATPKDVAPVIAALGLDHLLDRAVTEISVGERQRTMVARALAGRPAIVLADEPTAHQDERNGERVLALLRAAADAGAACLVTTRTPATVTGIADEVVRLR